MKKLLWVSHSPNLQHVGQSKVTREYCNRLCKNYDLRVVGWEHEAGNLPYFVYPASSFDSQQVLSAISDFKPDAIVLSHDVWRFYNLSFGPKAIKRVFPNIPIIGYFTIDGDPVHSSWLPMFQDCKVVVVPTRFGRDVIYQRYTHIPTVVIPYGVDHDVFNLVDKEVFKKRVDDDTKKEFEGTGKFVVETAGRFIACFVGHNQQRKNIGALIDGYRKFAQGKNNVLLILVVHHRFTNYEGYKLEIDYDIGDLISSSDIANKVYLISQVLPEKSVARVYKMADVLLYPSIGEAFGLPIVEAQACGTVPIATDYSSLSDINKGLKLEVVEFLRAKWNVKRAVVGVEDIRDKLEKAYTLWNYNKELWNSQMSECHKFAKSFTWDKSALMMKDTIEGALRDEDFINLEVPAL